MLSKINVIRYTETDLTILALTSFMVVLLFVISALLDSRPVR